MTSDERLRDVTPAATEFDPGAAAGPPARARAVVVGGGIIGASVAYHLARQGWTDTVVLERSRVSSGTSWHAAGLMTRTRGTHMQTELASYSRDFYRDLAALSGVEIGYYPNGSLSVARTPERLTELRYALTLAHHHGLPAGELTPDEIAGVSPILDVDDLVGGVLFEEDATVNPGWAAYATAKAAHDLGVRVVEGVRVTGFRLERGAGDGVPRVTAVETDRGAVECEVAVIAAGLWSRDLGLLAGARLALHPAEHYWAQTEPVNGATRDLPIVRDLDGSIYVRHYRGGLVVGSFEPDGRPRATSAIPDDFSFGEFEPDLEHFGRPLARARERVPALAEARFAHYLCAPESFTPDGNFLLGETAETAGLFVAAGMNSQGIILGPGVGRALAEWIQAGAPTVDASEVDVRRFSPAQANAGYLFERTRESLGRLYAMHWPSRQPGTARGLRRVPLYDRLAAAGAVFGETAGWERAMWYAPPGAAREYEYSYGRQNWFGAVAEEHRAAREAVALFDLSSFAKLRVEGPTALHAAQRVFSADLDRPPGAVVYTSMLNALGGVELDATVTRLREDAFLVVTSAAAQTRAFHWLRRHTGPDAVVTDVTSGLGVLSVTGPASARSARRAHGRGPERRRVPVRAGARDRRRLGDRARPAHLLRGRAGLGTVRTGGVAPRPVRPARDGRSRPRSAARRLPRPGRPARREGVRALGRGRRARRHAERGGPGVDCGARQGRRVHRQRGPARLRHAAPPSRAHPDGGPRAAPVPRRDGAPGRVRRRPRHLRRLRPHSGGRRRPGRDRRGAGLRRRRGGAGRGRGRRRRAALPGGAGRPSLLRSGRAPPARRLIAAQAAPAAFAAGPRRRKLSGRAGLGA